MQNLLPRPVSVSTLALAALLAAPAARAGFVIVGEHKYLDKSAAPFTYTLKVDKDKVRIESTNTPGSYYIYRGDKGLFWMVEGKEKTYTEMTKAQIDGMAAQMEAAMKKMKEQLAQLPPEQREMIEKNMKGMMPGAQSAPVYRKLGTDKAGAWSCDKYESSLDGVKRAELCVANPKAIGIPAGDYNGFRDLLKPYEKLVRDMVAFLPPAELEGVPVKSVFFRDGKANEESQVKSIKSENLAAATFDLPAGLTKRETGRMPGE